MDRLKKRTLLILDVSAAVILLALVMAALYRLDWSGFGEQPNPSSVTPAKTLWDWLDLLVVPAILAAGALWFNRQTGKREDAIKEDRYREEALQAYFDKMSELLLEKHLHDSDTPEEVRDVAQVRTITLLRRLDTRRIGEVLGFLRDADLLTGKTAVLRDATMAGIILERPDLHGANLSGTDLSGANLSEAYLRMADLHEANLSGANLSGTYLHGANLSGAYLHGANLSGTDLSGANLSGAAVSDDQLAKATLDENTTLPVGTKYKLPSKTTPPAKQPEEATDSIADQPHPDSGANQAEATDYVE